MRCISIVDILGFFPSPEIITSINILVPFSLLRIMMSGLLGRFWWIALYYYYYY